MSARHRDREYLPVDREASLKFAVQRINESGVRAQLIEGEFEIMAPTWDHENAVDMIRDGLAQRARELKCVKGSGNLDLPGTENWYLPDIAIIPATPARTDRTRSANPSGSPSRSASSSTRPASDRPPLRGQGAEVGLALRDRQRGGAAAGSVRPASWWARPTWAPGSARRRLPCSAWGAPPTEA